MLTILVTATADDLTVLENVREALDFPDTKHNTYLSRLITRSSRTIATLVAPQLGVEVYQAMLPSYGGTILQLPRYPIRGVLRVFDGSDTGLDNELSATEYRVDKERGWLTRDDGWPWTRQIEAGAVTDIVVPGSEYPAWFVEWGAGFVLAGGTTSTADGTTSTGPTLPPDLEEACISLVKARFLTRLRAPGVLSESVGDARVTYADRMTGEHGLPTEILALLEPFRSV